MTGTLHEDRYNGFFTWRPAYVYISLSSS